MASPGSTARLARASARRPWLVVAAWIVILALSLVAATGLGKALTAQEMSFLNQPESLRGDRLLKARLGTQQPEVETVVVHSDTLTADSPAFRSQVEALGRDLAALRGVVERAPTPFQLEALGRPEAQGLISPDRHTILVPTTLTPAARSDDAALDRLLSVLREHRSPEIQVVAVGGATSEREFMDAAAQDLRRAEVIGLPLTLVILVLVFGAAVAAGLSLVLALTSIGVAVGLTALVGRVTDLSFFTLNMVTMIGLAVGIDYALFIIERFREERRRGWSKLEAIERTGASASKAVLFSGVTVMLALLGLFLVPITTFRSLGAGAVLVVAVAVAAMLTLVPALLSLLGDRIDWPRRPRWLRLRRRRSAPPAAAPEADGLGGCVQEVESEAYRGVWGHLTRAVMVRPLVSVLLAAAILVVAALPYLDLQGGSSGLEALPPGDARTAYDLLARDFSAGRLSPVEIVLDAPRNSTNEAVVARVVGALSRDRAFVPGAQVTWSEKGDLAVISGDLALAPTSPAAYREIQRLREQTLPAAVAGLQGAPGQAPAVYVTGQTAFAADAAALISQRTPFVFAFVLGLSFILLLLVFRSIVVPIKAIIMNLFSVAAAYGLLVLVFQKGWGQQLLGFQRTPTIESWVPIFLFCVLFGLSMDYHVFLLSRIREHYDRTGRNAESVATGLRQTGRIITGAALIMVIVFATFASGRLVMMQQVGFGLAIAVFLDATLVRLVLVPASMALLDTANWYLPRWLRWLPDLRIEGEDIVPPPVLEAPVRPAAAVAETVDV